MKRVLVTGLRTKSVITKESPLAMPAPRTGASLLARRDWFSWIMVCATSSLQHDLMTIIQRNRSHRTVTNVWTN